jgi:hypothetical protein
LIYALDFSRHIIAIFDPRFVPARAPLMPPPGAGICAEEQKPLASPRSPDLPGIKS